MVISPLFLWSSVLWLCVIGAFSACIFETGEYGFKVAGVLKSLEPPRVLLQKHRRWADRVFVTGVANFVLTRVVTITAHVGFPKGWMAVFLWVHIVIGLGCIALYFLARTKLNGILHPRIHDWIVRIGLGGFFVVVIPSGFALYAVIVMKVLARSHIHIS